MEEQNKLIPINQNNLVQRVNTSISITNKLIAENNRQLVKEIFERNPKLFIDLICMYYPLNNELLEMLSFNFAVIEIKKRKEIEKVFEIDILNYEYDFLIGKSIQNLFLDFSFNDIKIDLGDIITCVYTYPETKTLDFLCKITNEEYLELKESWSKYNLIDWHLISCNENIDWNIDLIEKYNHNLDWAYLIKRINFPLNLKFIEKHINEINPFDIDYNINTWNINLIELYEKNDIHYNWVNFIEYKGVTLSEELIGYLINNFIHEFDWDLLWRIKQINIDILTIEKYKEKINWEIFSGLHNINWSIDLIGKFVNYWNWSKISSNNSLPINEVYKKHKKKTDLFGLSSNSSFNISLQFLKENENVELNWHAISENEKIIWDIESLELYKSKIKWHYLSKEYKFTKEMIFKFDNYIDFKCLSNNKNVIFDYEIINRYEDRLDFNYLSWRNDIPWTEKLITDFSDKWNWSNLSNNESILWTKELISKFDNKLLFNFNDSNPDSSIGLYYGLSIYGLSSNKNTNWSNELIENYIDKWNWDELSANENLPWSFELIEKYNEKWDWNILSCNPSLPWSFELVEKYNNKWDWKNLCYNSGLPWSEEFIKKYYNKIEWDSFSHNKSFPWSLILIHKYSDKFEHNEYVWNALKPYINDALIKEVFDNIKIK